MKKSQNVAEKYTCEHCDYVCSKLSDLSKHKLTRKHLLRTNSEQNVAEKYTCDHCEYVCSKLSDWKKHKLTRKHLLRTNVAEIATKTKFSCKKCNKEYSARNSLWYHEQRCGKQEPELVPVPIQTNVPYLDIINKLLTDNHELRNLIIEQSKITAETMNKVIEHNTETLNKALECRNTTVNQTNNNNKFNINMYLNEECKNAINFSDFIKNIEVSYKDLENNAQLGFVNGISKIFIDNLNTMARNERPIHCTDAKREIMYIKDDGKWNKETDDTKLQNAIKSISYKSIGKLLVWKGENDDYKDADSEFSQQCVHIQRQSLAGVDRDIYYPKVIHVLAKETMIEK